MNRKTFVKNSFLACVFLSSGFSVISLLKQCDRNMIRPPGASINDDEFLAHCIRCGKCSNACPYDVIESEGFKSGLSAGSPYLDVRENPCQLCADLPCIDACPTDALDHTINNSHDLRMGTAVITDREACLALRGIRCEACYRACPKIEKAISLKRTHNKNTGKHTIFEPVIHKDECTGCGICVNACVLDEPCIEVIKLNKKTEPKHYWFNYEI